MKYLTKKTVILFSFFTTVILLVTMEEVGFCRLAFGWIDGRCLIPVNDTLELIPLLFSITILPFSLITYRMKEDVFKAWIKFAVWWIPMTIILVLISPDGGGSMFVAGPSMQQISLAVLVGLFVVISFIKIIRAYRKAKNQTA